MFGAFLQQIGGYFDRRWLISTFFPSLVFWASLVLVYCLARGTNLVLEEWRGVPAELQLLLPVAGLIGLSFFAFFLSTVQLKILRLFEGYWEGVPVLGLVGASRRGYHQARLGYLSERSAQLLTSITAAESEEAGLPRPVPGDPPRRSIQLRSEQETVDLERFTTLPPDPSRVLPTALGNVLRAAEAYPARRYGLDGVLLWPRLQSFLPETLVSALGSSRTTLEASVNVAMLSGIFAVGAGTLVALFSGQRLLFAACLLGLPVAWAGYFGAVASAAAYSDLVRSSFDLYRGKLLEGLGFKAPKDYWEERSIWDDVNGLIHRAYPPESARYLSAAEPVPEAAAPLDRKRRVWNWITRTRADAHTRASAAPDSPPALTVTALAGASSQSVQPRNPEPPRDRRTTAAIAVLVMGFGIGGILVTGQLPWTTETVRATARDLPAYHVIRAEDLVDEPVDRAALPAGALTSDTDPVGQLTLAPVGARAILRRQQVRALPAGVTTEGTVALAVPVSASSVAGAGLRAGDLVDVIARTGTGAEAGADQQAASIIRLERVIVLNVPSVQTEPTASLLVAVPQESVDRLARRDPGTPVLVVRAL